MKLYGTLESERAKKSQGGNRILKYTLLIGSKDEPRHVVTLLANVVDNDVVLQYWANDSGNGMREIAGRIVLPLKANKQETEPLEDIKACEECRYSPCELHDK